MWTINDEDVESLRDATDGHVNVHQPLAAQCGLYFQPYCASVPMPPEILGRYVTQSLPCTNILMPCTLSFKLLGCMMAKALHDGRPFPLRISYALARCICGQVLEFDDLSTILNFHFFDVRPYFFCVMLRFLYN